MLASTVHILPLTTIRRKRVLPAPGRLLVRQGQTVEPHDVIAESAIASQHLLLNIVRSLGVSQKEAQSLIQRTVGERVSKDDLIAGPVGITRKVLRAPVSGRIALIRGGNVLLEVDSPPLQLRSGMSGIVTELIADRGAVIETVGALVQGAWGNGRMDFGLLQNKLQAPDSKLTPDQLDVSLRGTVVLGGFCNDPETLRNAVNIPLKGLVLSSMASSLVPLAAKIPLPIISLRGFGYRALDSASYLVLTTNENREVVVDAVAHDPFSRTRPEVFIPLTSSDTPSQPSETEDYGVGQKVRLVNSSSPKSIGTIERLTDKPVLLPSGVRTRSALISLENEETVMMPLVNLEILT
jgi:hypothetical protein